MLPVVGAREAEVWAEWMTSQGVHNRRRVGRGAQYQGYRRSPRCAPIYLTVGIIEAAVDSAISSMRT
jgi:hypothetical protein